MAKHTSATKDAGLREADIPRIPQSVELVNQTVSVLKEPAKDQFVWKNIVEYRNLASELSLMQDFENTL